MALSSAVQNARHTAQRVTWQDTDGDPLNLTGATLSGRRLDLETGQAVALDGALTLVEPEAGTFDWRYGAGDVAAAGAYQVQFVATFGDGLTDRTLAELWIVEPAL